MSEDKVNINLFLDSSKNNDNSGKSYDWTVNIPTNLINCDKDEGLRLNVVNFQMINSMNNVNYTNCLFNLVPTNVSDVIDGPVTNVSIPYGIYNVYTFMDYMNATYGSFFVMTYNKQSNSYTFKKTYTGPSAKIKLQVVSCGVFFGIANEGVIELTTTGYTGGCVNMAGYSKVSVLIKGIQYEDPTINNLGGDGFEESEILFWISRQQVAPFAELTYNDEDNGDLFNYKLFNKSICTMNLQLIDENLNPIYDAPHYQMILQFEKYKRDTQESLKLLATISNYMKQIYTVLLMLLEGLKII